jgi:hypothetical protein
LRTRNASNPPFPSASVQGRGGEDWGVDLAAALQSALQSSLDLGALVVLSGKTVWAVHADCLVLNDGGGVLGALSVAARAALAVTRLPKVRGACWGACWALRGAIGAAEGPGLRAYTARLCSFVSLAVRTTETVCSFVSLAVRTTETTRKRERAPRHPQVEVTMGEGDDDEPEIELGDDSEGSPLDVSRVPVIVSVAQARGRGAFGRRSGSGAAPGPGAGAAWAVPAARHGPGLPSMDGAGCGLWIIGDGGAAGRDSMCVW